MTKPINLSPALVSRFWSKVDRREPDECWTWTGEINTYGYGLICEWANDRRVGRTYAHRFAAALAGRDVDGLVVRHRCDNPPCVNPAHLVTGTQCDNIHDAMARGRLNMTGLAIGQAETRPPRPCARCGVEVSNGRRHYCPTCRVVVTQENRMRSAAKARGGLNQFERAALVEGAA